MQRLLKQIFSTSDDEPGENIIDMFILIVAAMAFLFGLTALLLK